jgi:hypothetical protein
MSDDGFDNIDELASTTPPENVIFLRVNNLTTNEIEYIGPFYAKIFADDFARHLITETEEDVYKIDYYTLSKLT